MPARVTSCPNCGGEVEFKAGSSLVTICQYCSSAVARVGGDVGELEILGRVAPLTDIGSPLSLGVEGKYHDKRFTLIGRIQLDYGLGPWNEWYASFEHGEWGWVAEAQGRVYFTFGKPAAGLPSYDRARVGASFEAYGLRLTIVERRSAKLVAGEGELPFKAVPGGVVKYCDFEGPKQAFGTIDYGTGNEAETFYIGEEVAYDQLFRPADLKDYTKGRAAAAVGLNCPNCGAAVALRAPDSAQRVTCPSCEAILDCGEGNQLFLLTSEKRRGPEPRIPLGASGTLSGVKWTVYGHLARSVVVEGVKYFWEEYLLHAEGRGYRWLVDSDGHWSFVEPIHAGDVRSVGSNSVFRDRRFRHFQSASATVENLRGEFYWKVSVGERASTADFVDPPEIISREMSADEVTWSLGHYLEKKELESAFHLKKPLPQPRGVGANQPNPHASSMKSGIGFAVVFTGILIALGMMFGRRGSGDLLFEQHYAIATQTQANGGRTAVGDAQLTPPFEIKGESNLAIDVASEVNNTWLFIEGTLVNQATNEVRPFGAGVSYYYGVDDGEPWTEGNRHRTVYLGSVPPGMYAVKLVPEWGPPTVVPREYHVRLRSGVFMPSHLLFALFVIWSMPILIAMAYYSFEKRRWAESDHG